MKTLILSIIASFGAFVAATGTIGCGLTNLKCLNV